MSFANRPPRSEKLKGLLLSAYHTPSHQHWCDQLQAMLPEVQWTLLSLPARYFNWRIRGNSLSWAFGEGETLKQPFDFVVATSMVDVSSLRGFVPSLAVIPWLVYFHENQFAYPLSQRQQLQQKQLGSSVESQLVPMYSALCAKKILFNSAFNRSTFLSGAEKLLQRFPDHVPRNLMGALGKARVLAVPVDCTNDSNSVISEGWRNSKLEIVWNHRWEYDKGPELLLAIVQEVIQRNLPLRFHVVGQQFRSRPEQFAQIETLLNDSTSSELGRFGYVDDRQEYAALLRQCDVVLSTASHDFQGLAIQEGMLRGCTPLVPDALVYPEYVPKQCRYEVTSSSAKAAVDILQGWSDFRDGLVQEPLVAYRPESLSAEYQKILEELLIDGL